MRTPEQNAQFEYVLNACDAAVSKYLSNGLQSMTELEKTICVVWLVDAEVNNGGFDQYFFNSSGDVFEETPLALERIGAPRAAALVRAAIAMFPDGRPALHRSTRHGQLIAIRAKAVQQTFALLDQSWYSEIEDIEELLANYLRRMTVN